MSICLFVSITFIAEAAGVACSQFYNKLIAKWGRSLLTACPGSFHLFCWAFCLLQFARAQGLLLEVSALLLSLSPVPVLSGQQDRRNDLSHPIHADNCLLDPEANECWKEPPAYTFRDYRYSPHLLQCQALAQQLSKTLGI